MGLEPYSRHTAPEIDRLIRDVDENHDDEIELNEFLNLLSHARRFQMKWRKVRLQRSFLRLDLDPWSVEKKLDLVASVRFLVFRFRLDAWWFGVPLLVRGPLLSLPVVLATDYPPVQIIVIATILTAFLVMQMLFWPWKVPLLNLTDCTVSFCITLLVTTSSLSLKIVEGPMMVFAEGRQVAPPAEDATTYKFNARINSASFDPALTKKKRPLPALQKAMETGMDADHQSETSDDVEALSEVMSHISREGQLVSQFHGADFSSELGVEKKVEGGKLDGCFLQLSASPAAVSVCRGMTPGKTSEVHGVCDRQVSLGASVPLRFALMPRMPEPLNGPLRLCGVLSSHVGDEKRLKRLEHCFDSIAQQTQALAGFFVVWSSPESLAPKVEALLASLQEHVHVKTLRQDRRTSQFYDIRWLYQDGNAPGEQGMKCMKDGGASTYK
eukprot:g31116.t1